jgi:ParB family chromosome partitioning protein
MMAKAATDLIVRDVPVGEMKLKTNARKDPLESELQALGESLKVCQYVPVILDPEMYLIDGWRRWLAAKLVGLATLKAIVADRPLTESELRIAQLTMSVHRAGLSGGELYDTCYELLQLNPTWLAKDLALRLQMDPSMMTRVLSPGKCILPVRQALKDGKIGLSDCYAISKEAEECQLPLLEMKLSGASRDALERHRRGKQRSSKGRTPQAKCLLPGGASVVVASRDISMPTIVSALSDALKAARKGCDEGYDVRTWEAMTRDRAKGATLSVQ